MIISGADFLKWCAVFGVETGNVGPTTGATKREVQISAFNFGDTTGADDAFVVSLNPAITVLTDGLLVTMSSIYSNLTTTPTLQIDSLTPVPIVLAQGADLSPGDIQPNNDYIFIYNLAEDTFQLINPTLSIADTFSVQENTYIYAIDSGIANSYVVTLIPTPETVTQGGQSIIMRVTNTNTGASTIAVNGNPAAAIVASDGTALVGGELVLNRNAVLIYNDVAGNWVLQNSALSYPGGVLPVPSGGTDRSSYNPYRLIAGGLTSTGALQQIAAGSNGQLLQSKGASALAAYTTTTYPATNAVNTIMYASSANVLGSIAAANSSVMVSSVAGVPSFSTTLPSALTIPLPKIDYIDDASGNHILGFTTTGSADYLRIAPATGQPEIIATGTSADINILLRPKAAGIAVIFSEALTQPFTIYNGTSSQHATAFTFANTAATRTVTYPDATGTLLMTGQAINTVPSIEFSSTSGVIGTTTNDDAATGSVGEYVTATGTTVSLTSPTAKTITSISLTAGDWDVFGAIQFNPAAGTTMSALSGSVSSTDNTGEQNTSGFLSQTAFVASGNQKFSCGPTRKSLSGTTTIYLVAAAAFAVSTMTATATIAARRVR